MERDADIPASMRTIVQPGPVLAERVRAVPVATSPCTPHLVAPGRDLFATVHDLVDRLGLPGAAFRLTGGEVRQLTLMTGGAGTGERPMDFKGPHVIPGRVAVVAGAGSAGCDEAGEPFSHCHAVFRDDAGRMIGGHLLPGETIAGDAGIAIELVPIHGARFVRRLDPETGFTLFHPERVA